MTVLDNNQLQTTSDAPIYWDENQVVAILHEILRALTLLERQCESTVIDLQAFPFGPGEEDQLLKRLGHGEVAVTINSIGRSTITETAHAGVWLVDHRNEENERIAFQLEITEVPALIRTPKSDIEQSRVNLTNELDIDNVGP